MAYNAKIFNGLSVAIEHRYYGVSQPFNSLTTDNLKYLSSEQALADTAELIMYLGKQYKIDHGKWVVFGGSYAGNLAAWFREKYPDLCKGAIASSAPVEAVVDFPDYLGVTSESLGAECSESISVVQAPSSDIKGFCKLATDRTGGVLAVDSYGKALKDHVNGRCFEFKYDKWVENVKETTLTSETVTRGTRQWIYQTCTEFGYYGTTNKPDTPFGKDSLPLDYFTQLCTDIFGPQITAQTIVKAVEVTNKYYGGRQPNVTNVVFTNGSLDPWHALSITKNLNNSTLAITIDGQSHWTDMWEPSPDLPKSLSDAYDLITKQVDQYLNA
ncbi:unnamed protein product [Oppiella nova]|uniref:Uncharacterized protein n=1 Tax=Oppiella nova TaxID=334625 RepID=A0A7R9QSW3_9ACAR|nr:unnamed protein product [Oppiella nova]CAG2173161.1 unnamed protein product [Oppiella nova]